MKRPARALASMLAGGAVLSPVHAVSAHAKKPTAVKVRHGDSETKKAAKAHGHSVYLLDAIFHDESRHNPRAYNRKSGATGLGQHTAGGRRAVERIRRARGERNWRYTRADAFDPINAIWATAELLAALVDQCGSLPRALGAYATGQCGKGLSYARRVLRYADWLRWREEPRT
jgi:soluble lytic murein transglycosylase-like protein